MKTEGLACKTKIIYLQCFQTSDTSKTSKYTRISLCLPKIVNFYSDANLSDVRFLSEKNQSQSCNKID